MNPEQQRIAIAEAVGWSARKDKDGFWRAVDASGDMRYALWMSERNVWSAGIPDFLNDLNAMHEAEKFILGTDLYIQYVNYIFRSVGLNRTYYMGATPEVFPADRQFAVFHATASQRAEAFLRTIGKWEEAK